MRWQAVRVLGLGEGAEEGWGDMARQVVIAALIDLGAGGVQEEGDALVAYLPEEAGLAPVRSAVAGREGVSIESEALGEVDWGSMWTSRVGVQRLGRIVVAPPWCVAEAGDAEHVVVVEPGMAFGTGEHATTRGMLRLIQRVIRGGHSVADVGAGSAILSIAAAKLGATRVYAIESDGDAIGNAEANVTANGVADRVCVLHGDAAVLLPLVAPVGVVVANIISSVLRGLEPVIRGAVSAGGCAILGGMLLSERREMGGALADGGWAQVAEDCEGDWWSTVVVPR
jgi:ribosomal protein L11 methyltransferase